MEHSAGMDSRGFHFNHNAIHSLPIKGEGMLRRSFAIMLFAACASILSRTPMSAQQPQSAPASQNASASASADQDVEAVRQDIRAHRKQIVAENMPLSPDEATKFWPVYDQYIQETIKINDSRWALIKDYAANYDKLTDALAEDYMKRSADVDQQLVALREKYVPIFEKVISAQKTAKWYQIDRRLDLIINLQLSAMIPMVDQSNPGSQ